MYRRLKDDSFLVADPFPVKGDFEAMRRWFARGLEERSLEANQLLCARAALRSVPFLSSWLPIPKLTVGNALYIGLLGVLRCYPISVSAMQLPLAVANEFKTRAAIASSAISDLSFIPLAAKSAANIAAHSEVDVYSNALTCAASAKTGAPEAYHAAAFEQDCRLLDSIGLTALACHRLWPDWDGEVAAAILPLMPADDGFDPSPKAFREELARFIPSMRNLPGDFLVWVEWYDGIVRGSRNGRYLFGLPTGDKFDPAVGPAEGTALRLNLDIAMIDNALWKGDPAELHAEIRRLVEVARGEEVEKPPEIPAQIAGTQWEIDEAGTKIRIKNSGFVEDEEELRDIRAQLPDLMECVGDLCRALAMCRSNYVRAQLEPRVEAYQRALLAERLSIDSLHAAGLRLKNRYDRVRQDAKAEGVVDFDTSIGEPLESVIGLNGPVVLATARGRILYDRAREDAMTREQALAYKEKAQEFVERVRRSRLLEQSSEEELQAVNDEIGAGPQPERSTDQAHGANRNLIAFLAILTIGPTEVAKQAIVTSGVGAQGALAGATLINIAVAFMTTNAPFLASLVPVAGDGLAWLPHYLNWLSAKRRR